MNEVLQQTGNILTQSQELLKQPAVKGAVSGFLSWIGSKIFAGKKAKQMIPPHPADTPPKIGSKFIIPLKTFYHSVYVFSNKGLRRSK